MNRLLFVIMLLLLPVHAYAIDSITLTEPVQGRIYQRHSGAAQVTISGTCTGSDDVVEYRIVHNGSDKAVAGHNWRTLNTSDCAGKGFSNAVRVPEGGWYRVDVRAKHGGPLVHGPNKWGVGTLIAVAGQSNAEKCFTAGQSVPPHALLRYFNGKSWLPPRTGDGCITLGNELIQTLRVPVGLIFSFTWGSTLRQEADFRFGWWVNSDGTVHDAGGAPYAYFEKNTKAAGGELEFIVWDQGEGDAMKANVTRKEYRKTFRTLARRMRADVRNASDRKALPIIMIVSGRITVNDLGTDATWSDIRDAQMSLEDIQDVYLGGFAIDATLHDVVHRDPAGFVLVYGRTANTIKHLLDAKKYPYYRGPHITGASCDPQNRTITVHLAQRGGSDIIPAKGATGFTVDRYTVSFVTRASATSLVVKLNERPGGTVVLRYLYGRHPVITNVVKDNTALHLPLEPVSSLPVDCSK